MIDRCDQRIREGVPGCAGYCQGADAVDPPNQTRPRSQLLGLLLRDTQLARPRLSSCQTGRHRAASGIVTWQTNLHLLAHSFTRSLALLLARSLTTYILTYILAYTLTCTCLLALTYLLAPLFYLSKVVINVNVAFYVQFTAIQKHQARERIFHGPVLFLHLC